MVLVGTRGLCAVGQYGTVLNQQLCLYKMTTGPWAAGLPDMLNCTPFFPYSMAAAALTVMLAHQLPVAAACKTRMYAWSIDQNNLRVL